MLVTRDSQRICYLLDFKLPVIHFTKAERARPEKAEGSKRFELFLVNIRMVCQDMKGQNLVPLYNPDTYIFLKLT